MTQLRLRERIKNCFATTGIALVVLTIIASLYHANFLCIETVFQVLFVSVILNVALALLERIESKYLLVEVALDLCTTLVILGVAGAFFGWYSNIPPWVLVVIGVIVYLFGSLLDLYRVQKEVQQINELLHQKTIGRTYSN